MPFKPAMILGRFLSNCPLKSSLHYALFLKIGHQMRHFSFKPKFDFGYIRDPDDAVALFKEMMRMKPHRPSAINFNKLLSALVKMKYYSIALRMFVKMLRRGAPVDDYIMTSGIDYCCRLKRVDFGFEILGSFFKRGYESNAVTFNTLIKGLLLVGKIEEAAKLLNKLLLDQLLCKPDERTYNIMINGLCKAGQTLEALHLLGLLEKVGGRCKPNVYAYSIVINALCKDRMVHDAFQLFSTLADKGISPNVQTYNSMIWGFCSSSRWDEAEDLLKKMMADEVHPNVVTCNILVDAHCKERRVEEAESIIFETMKQIDVEPDIVIYNTLINGYCLRGEMDKARNIFDLAVSSGLKPDIVSYGSLMNGYCKKGVMEEVLRLFIKVHADEGLEHNVVPYNIMLHALFREGRCEDGLKLFEDMQALQMSPDIITYNTLLDGLCSAHRTAEVSSVLRTMEDKDIIPNIVMYNTLIKGLCNGKKVETMILFDGLPSKGMQSDVITYTILIGALCEEEQTWEAKDLFLKMVNNGCLPDSISRSLQKEQDARCTSCLGRDEDKGIRT